MDPRGDSKSGGTTAADWVAIADSQGLALHLETQTPEGIQQAVAEKRGLISAHAAGKLWGMPEVTGGHGITVTGVEYDSDGHPTNYMVDDTGSGEGAAMIPASRFTQSLLPGYQMGVATRVWLHAAVPSRE